MNKKERNEKNFGFLNFWKFKFSEIIFSIQLFFYSRPPFIASVPVSQSTAAKKEKIGRSLGQRVEERFNRCDFVVG